MVNPAIVLQIDHVLTMRGETMTTIKITSFAPLQLEMPAKPGPYLGPIAIQLPAVHYNFYDLSMGGMIPGEPHLGADLEGWQYTFEAVEPMTLGKLIELVTVAKDDFKKLHKLIQRGVTELGPLMDRKRGNQ